MDRQGGRQDPEVPVRCRNGDSLDFPALQAMQSGTARPGAGPAGACLHRPPVAGTAQDLTRPGNQGKGRTS